MKEQREEMNLWLIELVHIIVFVCCTRTRIFSVRFHKQRNTPFYSMYDGK